MSGERQVGLIGCGAIGTVVARQLAADAVSGARLAGIAVRSTRADLPGPARTVDELIECSDVIVEAAGQQALAAHGPTILSAGVDLVAVSIGALADAELREAMGRAGPGRLHVASGAIGGLDLIRSAAAMGPIETASITTTKRPEALYQAWMADTERQRLASATEPVVLFDGDVRELVRLFPTSTNVAAAVALAIDSWEVIGGKVVADPEADLTSHVITVSGEAGTYRFEIRNRPSPLNPRSSGIVPWAVVRVLRDLCGTAWRFA